MPGEEKTVGDHVLIALFLILLCIIAWAYWVRSRTHGGPGSRGGDDIDIEVREGSTGIENAGQFRNVLVVVVVAVVLLAPSHAFPIRGLRIHHATEGRRPEDEDTARARDLSGMEACEFLC